MVDEIGRAHLAVRDRGALGETGQFVDLGHPRGPPST
jgi:hypothetical protein